MPLRSLVSSFALCVLAGCSFQASCGGKSLNMDKAKEFVSTALEAEVGEKPTKVACPASVKISKGATFECTVEFGAPKATVVLSQEDDEGYVKVKSVTGILISKKAEAEIASQLGAQLNAHFTVDCGQRIRTAKAGDTFVCAAKDAQGQGGPVTVTMKDIEGNVSFAMGDGTAATPPPTAEVPTP